MTRDELLTWLREEAEIQERAAKQCAWVIGSQAHTLGLCQGAAVAYRRALARAEGLKDDNVTDDDHDTYEGYMDRQEENERESVATWCPQCGPRVDVDEDGCCVSCGATATGDGADMAAAWRQLAQDMGEFLSDACPDALAWEGDGGLAERLDALEFADKGGRK